jgi:hypothetical protein
MAAGFRSFLFGPISASTYTFGQACVLMFIDDYFGALEC